MALFGFKKKEETNKDAVTAKPVKVAAAKKAVAAKPRAKKTAPVVAEKAVAISGTPSGTFTAPTDVIIRPHITEKAGTLSQKNVYTFQIVQHATKQTVAQAIRALYKVNPIKVAIINLPDRNVFVRGRRGMVSGKRKALVTVKAGDKIDFV